MYVLMHTFSVYVCFSGRHRFGNGLKLSQIFLKQTVMVIIEDCPFIFSIDIPVSTGCKKHVCVNTISIKCIIQILNAYSVPLNDSITPILHLHLVI